MLFCGCQNKTINTVSVTEFTCEFTNGDTVGTVSCTPDAVTISNIKVCDDDVGIAVQITTDKYTITTANAKAEYFFNNSDPFPLAEFGLTLLKTANGETSNNIEVSNKGLITSVTTESGVVYTLKYK